MPRKGRYYNKVNTLRPLALSLLFGHKLNSFSLFVLVLDTGCMKGLPKHSRETSNLVSTAVMLAVWVEFMKQM